MEERSKRSWKGSRGKKNSPKRKKSNWKNLKLKSAPDRRKPKLR